MGPVLHIFFFNSPLFQTKKRLFATILANICLRIRSWMIFNAAYFVFSIINFVPRNQRRPHLQLPTGWRARWGGTTSYRRAALSRSPVFCDGQRSGFCYGHIVWKTGTKASLPPSGRESQFGEDVAEDDMVATSSLSRYRHCIEYSEFHVTLRYTLVTLGGRKRCDHGFSLSRH